MMTDEELAAAHGFESVSDMLDCCASDHDKMWLDCEDGQWITYHGIIHDWTWCPDVHEPYEGV